MASKPVLLAAAISASLFFPTGSVAQTTARTPAKEKSGKDMFYNPAPGQQGMKVSIKLNRGGNISEVPPSYSFKTGDLVRIVFSTNFNGYVSVTNQDLVSPVKALYPVAGQSARVVPSSNFEIPASGWFEFGKQTGQEHVTVVLSPTPLQGLTTSGQTSSQEQQEILDLLNQKALKESKRLGVKDMSYVQGDPIGYISTPSVVEQPWGFELYLSHQ